MGQQQLVLMVLGVILISITFVIGLSMFLDHSSTSNRDGVINDLADLADHAHVYYRRLKLMGGGEGSYNGIAILHLTNKATGTSIVNANGTYTITSVSGTDMTINGRGKDAGYDGSSPVEANILVRSGALSDSVVIVN